MTAQFTAHVTRHGLGVEDGFVRLYICPACGCNTPVYGEFRPMNDESSDPIREKFEQWWNGSKYMQVVRSDAATKRAALDGFLAGRASVIEELKPAAWEVPRQGVFKTRLAAEVVAAVHGGDLKAFAPIPKE